MPEKSTENQLLTPELLAQLERMELVSRKIFRGRMKGERRSRRRGQSVEFADFRNYVPGDDLRFMDWNLYARLEKLFLKLYLEEEDLHFYALIDASMSMDFGDPTKLHYAKQLAAALGFIGLCRADRVRIETLAQPPQRRGPVLRGRGSVWRMLQYLNTIECTHPCLATNHTLGGWMHLIQRIEIAKNWARRMGTNPLVREINAITAEGISGLNEVILGHCSALDMLITETFSQHGITYEIHGMLSPFTSYTMPMVMPVEKHETVTPVPAADLMSPAV